MPSPEEEEEHSVRQLRLLLPVFQTEVVDIFGQIVFILI